MSNKIKLDLFMDASGAVAAYSEYVKERFKRELGGMSVTTADLIDFLVRSAHDFDFGQFVRVEHSK